MEDDEEDENDESGEPKKNNNGVQTLDSLQAMCLPLGASISLMIMFFFFDSMQILFAICTAVIATMALAFLVNIKKNTANQVMPNLVYKG